jgi:hypothetical protein
MCSAVRQATPHTHKNAALYRARHPEQTLLYRTIVGYFETWLELASAGQFDGQGDHHTPATHVVQAFRKYLECGIFAHGFARVRCGHCGDDFLIAFSCKGRALCPSCNTRRMALTAAHLTDHVFLGWTAARAARKVRFSRLVPHASRRFVALSGPLLIQARRFTR